MHCLLSMPVSTVSIKNTGCNHSLPVHLWCVNKSMIKVNMLRTSPSTLPDRSSNVIQYIRLNLTPRTNNSHVKYYVLELCLKQLFRNKFLMWISCWVLAWQKQTSSPWRGVGLWWEVGVGGDSTSLKQPMRGHGSDVRLSAAGRRRCCCCCCCCNHYLLLLADGR